MGCQTTLVNKEVVEQSDVIFIAVKPHLVIQVAQEIESSVDPSKHLIVSIAAAITTDVIEAVSNLSTIKFRLRAPPPGYRPIYLETKKRHLANKPTRSIPNSTGSTLESGLEQLPTHCCHLIHLIAELGQSGNGYNCKSLIFLDFS